MSHTYHERLTDLLAEALALPEQNRAEFIDSACGDDANLRRDLEELLECSEKASNAFDVDLTEIGIAEPEQIGQYRIIEPIGEGGMAIVYKAEQERPVRRLVAIKIIKLGMDTRQFVARFEVERQMLAMIDHPHVARVFDAGATDSGRPYFVMEYVPGEPILPWCDQRNLTLRQRLELFVQVCEAVESAHRKGIIHRDLKSSNVLVTQERPDTSGVPKVIDFGVAKAISRQIGEASLVTEQGQIIGTPGYISPEQAEYGDKAVDTRSDVFSLGVLLYELLAGVRPIDTDAWSSGGFENALRAMREAEAPMPPARFSALSKEQVEAIAGHRGLSSATLRRQLGGELAWIPLKAMRKDRELRYRSASELADDIRRYLEGKPLIAGPESTVYRFGKFIRRNRTATIASAAVLLSLIASTGISVAFAIHARREAVRATLARTDAERRQRETQQVADFQSRMLRDIDVDIMGHGIKDEFRRQVRAALERTYIGEFPNQHKRSDAEIDAEMAAYDARADSALPADVARRVLDQYVLRPAGEIVEKEFVNQPLVRAEILAAIGSNYMTIGQPEIATLFHRTALKLRREVDGPESEAVARHMDALAYALATQGKYTEAESLYLDALAMQRKLKGNGDPFVAEILTWLGRMQSEKRDLRAAEATLREALAIKRKLLPGDSRETAICLQSLAAALRDKGDYPAAEPLFAESLAIFHKLDRQDQYVSALLRDWVKMLVPNGDYVRAEQYMRESHAMRQRAYGDDHPQTATFLNDLGWVLNESGNAAAAEEVFREALARQRKLRGDQHREVATCLNNLGSLLQDKGDFEAAERCYREALAIYRKVFGDESEFVALGSTNLASLLHSNGKSAEAESLLRTALALRRRLLGDEHSLTLITTNHLGKLLVDTGRPQEAIALLAPLEAAERKAFPPPNALRLGRYLTHLGRARGDLREFELAEANLTEAHATILNARKKKPRDMPDVVNSLVELYRAWHAANPIGGYDAKEAQWRVKFAKTPAATQSATQPAMQPPSPR